MFSTISQAVALIDMSYLFSSLKANKTYHFFSRIMNNRRRGIQLNSKGKERLGEGREKVEYEENRGLPFTYEEIKNRIEYQEGKPTGETLSTKKIGQIFNHGYGDPRSIKPLFKTFGLNLESDDWEYLPKPILQPFGEPSIWNETKKDYIKPPDVPVFYGRQQELSLLGNWIVNEQCRLITIYGYGGTGKTALAIKLAENVHSQFKYRVWYSIREKPKVEEVLAAIIETLSNEKDKDIPKPLDRLISRFIYYLNQTRCLLVIDNMESVIQRDSNEGQYSPEYEGYGRLLSRLAEARHNSCVIFTSRIVPREIEEFKGNREPVKIFQLKGVYHQASHEFSKA
ncbi:MAG: NB-ARC domain-containing protein, partial [Bacteroidota bacterium]